MSDGLRNKINTSPSSAVLLFLSGKVFLGKKVMMAHGSKIMTVSSCLFSVCLFHSGLFYYQM